MSFYGNRKPRLNEPIQVREELGKAYRCYLRGEIPIEDLGRIAKVLGTLCGMMKSIEAEHLLLEIREEFEAHQRTQRGNGHDRARAY